MPSNAVMTNSCATCGPVRSEENPLVKAFEYAAVLP